MHDLAELLREYDRARAYTDSLWRDLSVEHLTWRPHPDSSAIGWHVGQWICEVRADDLGLPLPPDPDADTVRRVDGYLVLAPG